MKKRLDSLIGSMTAIALENKKEISSLVEFNLSKGKNAVFSNYDLLKKFAEMNYLLVCDYLREIDLVFYYSREKNFNASNYLRELYEEVLADKIVDDIARNIDQEEI